MEDAQAVLRGSLCVYVVLDCNQTSLNLTYIARLLVCYNAPQTWKLRQSASSLASFFPTDRRESLPTCRRRAHARYMPPTFTGFDTSSAILQSGGPKNVWTDNEKTRTALGDAIHWFPAYNDGVAGEVPMLLRAPGCCSLLLVCSYAACCSRLLAVDIALPLYSR